MITVVVPVLNQLKMTNQFLRHILNNVVLPKEIILIDNGSTDNIRKSARKFGKVLPITYVRYKKNMGVNYAWRDGINRAKTDLICVLNNDIIINKFFFKKIIETANINNNFGVICGTTLKTVKAVTKNTKDEPVKFIEGGMKKGGEGWAYTIRKDLRDKIPPIPNFLENYYGDYYYFLCSKLLGYKNIKILNNNLFHHGSVTVLARYKRPKNTSRRGEQNKWIKHRATLIEKYTGKPPEKVIRKRKKKKKRKIKGKKLWVIFLMI